MLYLIAFLIPPLGVLLAGASFGALLVNVALCLLGYVPGIIHAWYIIHRRKEWHDRLRVPSNTNVNTVTVNVPGTVDNVPRMR